MPRLSVIICARNAAPYLAATLDSLRAQTFADWEALLVDDGSTDDTVAIARRYPWLKILSQPARGLSGARNAGIENTVGEYVALLDADDLWRKEKLARQVSALDANPGAALTYCDADYVDAAGAKLPGRRRPNPHPLFGEAILPSSVIFRRSVCGAELYFDPRFQTLPEIDLFFRLRQNGKTFLPLPEPLLDYRIHPGGLSRDPAILYSDAKIFLAQLAGQVDDRTLVRATIRLAGWLNSLAGGSRAAKLLLPRLTRAPHAVVHREVAVSIVAAVLPKRLYRLMKSRFGRQNTFATTRPWARTVATR